MFPGVRGRPLSATQRNSVPAPTALHCSPAQQLGPLAARSSPWAFQRVSTGWSLAGSLLQASTCRSKNTPCMRVFSSQTRLTFLRPWRGSQSYLDISKRPLFLPARALKSGLLSLQLIKPVKSMCWHFPGDGSRIHQSVGSRPHFPSVSSSGV